MSQNNKEATIVLKRTKPRYIVIQENIHQALDLYTLSLYMAFRYESDYDREDAVIQRSSKFLYEKAKISRRQFFISLNILEDHGLVLRDPSSQLNSTSIYHVAQELNYFNTECGVVHDVHGGVHHMHTNHYSFPLSNINITSDVSESVKTKDVIEAYHEACPECPKIKVCGNELTKQIRSMIRNWPKYNNDNKEFTIDSFKDYLNYIKLHYPWFLQPYMTESGKEKRNNLTNITREKNIVRIVNGEFSGN